MLICLKILKGPVFFGQPYNLPYLVLQVNPSNMVGLWLPDVDSPLKGAHGLSTKPYDFYVFSG